jgi:hypothetical protein
MDHPLLEPFEVRFFDEQRAILVEVTLRYCRGQTFADAILPVCERAQTAGKPMLPSNLSSCELNLTAALRHRLVQAALQHSAATKEFYRNGRPLPWHFAYHFSPTGGASHDMHHDTLNHASKAATTANDIGATAVRPFCAKGVGMEVAFSMNEFRDDPQVRRRVKKTTAVLLVGLIVVLIVATRNWKIELNHGRSLRKRRGLGDDPVFSAEAGSSQQCASTGNDDEAGPAARRNPESAESPSARLSTMLRSGYRAHHATLTTPPSGRGGALLWPSKSAGQVLTCAEIEAQQYLEERTHVSDAARVAIEIDAATTKEQQLQDWEQQQQHAPAFTTHKVCAVEVRQQWPAPAEATIAFGVQSSVTDGALQQLADSGAMDGDWQRRAVEAEAMAKALAERVGALEIAIREASSVPGNTVGKRHRQRDTAQSTPMSRNSTAPSPNIEIIGYFNNQFEVRWRRPGEEPEDFWFEREELMSNYSKEVLEFEKSTNENFL